MARNLVPEAPRRGLPPSHPGELLKEIVLPALKESGVSKVAVCQHLGVGRNTLEDLLNGRSSVSPEMALRLGKLCGNGPDLWLNLQKEWDLARARERLGPALEAIPTLEAGQQAA